jgi:hypothetical protein
MMGCQLLSPSSALGSGCTLVVLAAPKKLAAGYRCHPAAAGQNNAGLTSTLTQSVVAYKPTPKPSREGKPSLDYCNTLVLNWCNDHQQKHF